MPDKLDVTESVAYETIMIGQTPHVRLYDANQRSFTFITEMELDNGDPKETIKKYMLDTYKPKLKDVRLHIEVRELRRGDLSTIVLDV